MNKDPAPVIVLQNKLRRSKEKLIELDNLMNGARKWEIQTMCRPFDPPYIL